jgi:FAD binding domain/Berberine and berberine like
MIAAETRNKLGITVAKDLRAVMQGKVAIAGEASYDEARQVFNGAVDRRPKLFAFCESARDVQKAVRAARACGLPLSVRGGGHDWAGRALSHQGLVVDLSRMRQVEVDVRGRVATVAGGARAIDVIAAAGPHGLAAVTGAAGAVGLAGLLTGGGYGPLLPRFGLALDNLLGAEVVLADGQIVFVDSSQNSELFWAIRGGGGNFGVVTSLLVRLHPIEKVLAGLILFPLAEAMSVLTGYCKFASSAPEELSVIGGIVSAPDGKPCVLLAPTWSGESKRGEEVVAGLLRLGTPLFTQLSWMTFQDLLALFDAQLVEGRHYFLRTRSLAALSTEAISELIAAGNARTSPHTVILWHHFRGRATRIPVGATSFGIRAEHFMVEVICCWDPTSEKKSQHHRQWAKDLSKTLAPMALPGGYPNMLGPDDSEQIPFAYGSNAERLMAAKNRFDQDEVFSSATPLPVR